MCGLQSYMQVDDSGFNYLVDGLTASLIGLAGRRRFMGIGHTFLAAVNGNIELHLGVTVVFLGATDFDNFFDMPQCLGIGCLAQAAVFIGVLMQPHFLEGSLEFFP